MRSEDLLLSEEIGRWHRAPFYEAVLQVSGTLLVAPGELRCGIVLEKVKCVTHRTY
jgi:hypothetical protein